jgi:hypothetical protein
VDPVIILSFFLFALYVSSRVAYRIAGRVRASSSVPQWVGDPLHFGAGLFIARVDPVWACLASALYVIYQVLDWKINGSNAARDTAVYLAGVLSGLGYDAVRLWAR